MVDILIPRLSGTSGLRDDTSQMKCVELVQGYQLAKIFGDVFDEKCVVSGFNGEWERKERL